MPPFLFIKNIMFYVSDFVLLLCIHRCIPSNCNAMNCKSQTVTMILIKAEFTGNITLLVQVVNILQYVYFWFLLSCFITTADKCTPCSLEQCTLCNMSKPLTTQCPDTTCPTSNPSTSVCSCPATEAVGKLSTTNYY